MPLSFQYRPVPNAVSVFNAGLIIFGSLLCPQYESEKDLGSKRKLEHGKQVLGKAIEALSHIGDGITLIDRCIACLQRLLQLVEEWSRKISLWYEYFHVQIELTLVCLGSFPTTSNSTACVAPQLSQTMTAPAVDDTYLRIGLPLFGGDFQFDGEFDAGSWPSKGFQRWFSNTPWQSE